MSLPVPQIYAERYEIIRPIGDGAFSRTFLARDTVLQRDVALKLLRREHRSNPEFSARFDREAQAAARVAHSNVVPVFDFGRQGDLPFIVMQYVDGRTLREFDRDEGPLTIEEVVSIGRQVLDGLSAIHAQGIVHRDIKPQNILLDKHMVARLTDFGVAFLSNDVTLTQTGMTIGTAAYMAPEQATGQPVGPAADIYSVGVMLYELLTGRLPFEGENPVQMLYRHVSVIPPRPRDFNPQIPVELESVILRSLAKIPSERFPDARSMRESLGKKPTASAVTSPQTGQRPQARPAASRATHSRPTAPTRPVRQPKSRRSSSVRWLWALAGGLLIALLATLIVVVVANGLGGGGDGQLPAAIQPTETEPESVMELPGIIEPSPTSTATSSPETPPEATATATAAETEAPATPTAAPESETPSPTQAPQPTEEASEPDPTSPPPTNPPAPPAPFVNFDEPFLVSTLPPAWNQGASVVFDRDDFVAGGAYRRTDGVLYGQPAAHLYSQQTDYPSTTVSFTALEAPGEYIGIVIRGMDDELPGHVPCRVILNGNVVWEGDAQFGNETWTLVGWRLGNLTWIQEGLNQLTLEVLAPVGDFGLPPWILLNEARVYWD